MEKFHQNADKIFKEFWNKKADEWVKEIQSANLPEDLEAQLTFFIERIFIDEYIEAPNRDPKQLEMFFVSFYQAIQESGDDQGKSKFKIYEKIKDAINSITENERLKKEN